MQFDIILIEMKYDNCVAAQVSHIMLLTVGIKPYSVWEYAYTFCQDIFVYTTLSL